MSRINVFLASIVLSSLAAGVNAEQALVNLERAIYDHPMRVDDELGDFLRTSTSHPDLRRWIGKSFSPASKRYLPLDSALAKSVIWASYKLTAMGSNAYRSEIEQLRLERLDELLERRLTEIQQDKLRPIDRVLEQRMYWELRDAVLQLADQMQGPESTTARSIAQRLLALIRLLRLEPADVNELSRYDQLALIKNIYVDMGLRLGTPFVLDVSNHRNVNMHGVVAEGRSCFVGLAVLGNANHKDKKWLEAWKDFYVLQQQVLNRELSEDKWLGKSLPALPPTNTVLILFKRMIAIDDQNRAVSLPVVERAAVRFYVSKKPGVGNEKYALYELNKEVSRRQHRWKYEQIKEDELVWAGLLSGAPDIVSVQGALITTMRNNCASCHNFASPGPGQLLSYTMGRPELSLPKSANQCDLTVRYLETTSAFKRLKQDLELVKKAS